VRIQKLDAYGNKLWDGRNENDISVKEGIYYYQITSGEIEHSGKIIKN